jgi:hypothetical protein
MPSCCGESRLAGSSRFEPGRRVREFPRLRADALLSDDDYKSDLAWLDLKDPKFDIIFALYALAICAMSSRPERTICPTTRAPIRRRARRRSSSKTWMPV